MIDIKSKIKLQMFHLKNFSQINLIHFVIENRVFPTASLKDAFAKYETLMKFRNGIIMVKKYFYSKPVLTLL